MAIIDEYLQNIQSATYGEEVRQSIHDAIEAINDERNELAQERVDTAVETALGEVTDELSNLKSDLKYNSLDLIANAPRTVGTNQGIQYTWNKNVCTVVGTATGASQNNIISNGIPADYGFAIGEKYIVKYSSTDIRFRVYCRVNGVFTEVLNTVTDAEFVIPENTSDITIRLTVPNGKTVSEVISPAILNARSNKEIAGEINSIKRTDAGILLPFFASWNAQYNADGKLSLLDMPINSVCYIQFNTILESQVENFPITDFGAIYIEKIGRGNFAFYKIFANNRPHIVYGYYASNKFSWFCNQSIYPLKIGMLGDSVTAGRIGGQTGNTDKGIPYWVMCETGMNVVNLGVGSQGWISKQYLDQNAEEYIQTLDLSSYDVLTFMYGANDGDISLGDYDDTTEQTIMGAVYRCVNYAMTQNPRLRIILINHPLGTSANFPHYNPNAQHSAPDHWTFSQYFEQIRLFGTKYAIPVIDGWRALNAWNRSLYIGDNVHPTIAGYKVVGQYIAGQIKSMI